MASAALCRDRRRASRERPTTRLYEKAKAYLAEVAAPVTKWDGPTTGPKAHGKKLIIYRLHRPAQRRRAGRRRRRGRKPPRRSAGTCASSTARAPFRAHASAMTQAIAMKPDGIILRRRSTPPSSSRLLEQAAAAGIKVVGWHAGPKRRPGRGHPGRLHQRHHRPDRSREASPASRRSSSRTARRASSCSPTRSTRSPPPRPTRKRRRSKAARAARCWRSRTPRSRDLANRMGAADDVAALEIRQGVDLFDRRQRPLLTTSRRRRCSRRASIRRPAIPQQISAGDGSVPAFQRIRDKQYQIATVAEPLHLQGWHMIDEMNRAFAGEQPSGLRAARPSVHRRQYRQGRRRAEHVRSRQRLQRHTRRSGA